MSKGIIGVILLGFLLGTSTDAIAFDFRDVVRQAQELAQKPYVAPPKIPGFLQNLSFEQYQGIRFNPDKSLWRNNHSLFQVMLISPGLYYKHPVKIDVVDAGGSHALAFQKSDFNFAEPQLEKRVPPDLGFAGFKLTYPLNSHNTQNQFLVFAGASYFRGVGKNDSFGLSGRGIAVNTGLPAGEEFPSFIQYWLIRPNANAHTMKFYALLDGKSLTGAYRFIVVPGRPTQLKVKAMLFPRDNIALLGLAPLTSMFFYGQNTPRPTREWRPQVHDSDGLLIHNGSSGEWLWRPLIDPKQLQMYYFDTDNVRGFGLLQRQTEFYEYQDLGAHYEARPSAWIVPRGNWGKGKVVLVELPATNETSDNIVAFWTPTEKVTIGKPISLTYDLSFGKSNLTGEPGGMAQATFVGGGNIIGGGQSKGAYRLIVDFSGGSLDRLRANAPVTGAVTAQDGGTVLENFVEYVEPLHRWRLSILAKPAAGKDLALRAFLKNGDKALTETWNYDLPLANQFKEGGS